MLSNVCRLIFILMLIGFNPSKEDSSPKCDIKNTEYFVDKWGLRINWTLPQDGWTERKREQLKYLDETCEFQPRVVPAFTKRGYKKTKIPRDVLDFILKSRMKHKTKVEDCKDSAHMNCDRLVVANGTKVANDNALLVQVRELEIFVKVIGNELKPILESWSGVKLVPTSVYGIRRYLPGSWLQLHVDRLNTHVISAILQIVQDVDEEWPLFLIDLQGNKRKILMKPGDMVLYESAKIPHGRQLPLKGKFFENIFVHYKPKDLWYDDIIVDSKHAPKNILTKEDILKAQKTGKSDLNLL